jgi:hypothetical protein
MRSPKNNEINIPKKAFFEYEVKHEDTGDFPTVHPFLVLLALGKLCSEERLPTYHTRMAIPSMGMAMGALLELR